MSAGYSKTPLIKKLGIKENFLVKLYHTPDNYFSLLNILPAELSVLANDEPVEVDFIHYFANQMDRFIDDLQRLKSQIKQNGMIWISWNKTKSKQAGELNENLIRQYAINFDLVDIKVCAVDATWSGLKLVIRKEKRYKS